MGLIKQLKNALKTQNIYPVTKTKAVYDDEGNKLSDTLTSLNDSLNQVNTNLLKYEIIDKGSSVASSDVFPFTAEHDGIMTLVMTPSASTGYFYIVDDTDYQVGACTVIDSHMGSMAFILQKGKTYRIGASSNVGSIKRPQIMYFYK